MREGVEESQGGSPGRSVYISCHIFIENRIISEKRYINNKIRKKM